MTLALYAGPLGGGQAPSALYGSVGFDQWNGGNWVLPKNGEAFAPIPDQLETTLQAQNGFALDNGGNGGRLVASVSGVCEMHASFTVIRPPAVSLDSRAIFSLAVGGVAVAGSNQSLRLNIIDCDAVVTLVGVFPVFANQTVGVLGGSDAGALTPGLGIQLKGYTLLARFVQVL